MIMLKISNFDTNIILDDSYHYLQQTIEDNKSAISQLTFLKGIGTGSTSFLLIISLMSLQVVLQSRSTEKEQKKPLLM